MRKQNKRQLVVEVDVLAQELAELVVGLSKSDNLRGFSGNPLDHIDDSVPGPLLDRLLKIGRQYEAHQDDFIFGLSLGFTTSQKMMKLLLEDSCESSDVTSN